VTLETRNSSSSTESTQCCDAMKQRRATTRESTRPRLCRLVAECRPTFPRLRVGQPSVGWALEVFAVWKFDPPSGRSSRKTGRVSASVMFHVERCEPQ